MRKPKKTVAPAPIAESQPLETSPFQMPGWSAPRLSWMRSTGSETSCGLLWTVAARTTA